MLASVLNLFSKVNENLSTKLPKPIHPDDLKIIYIDGIQRQEIKLVKNYLHYLGISKYDVKNISFIGNHFCKLEWKQYFDKKI